jgi:hypothetical protein
LLQLWQERFEKRSRTTSRVVRPCLDAFCEERIFPSGVRGPVEFCALTVLAAS